MIKKVVYDTNILITDEDETVSNDEIFTSHIWVDGGFLRKNHSDWFYEGQTELILNQEEVEFLLMDEITR
jgi:hypothetical protein